MNEVVLMNEDKETPKTLFIADEACVGPEVLLPPTEWAKKTIVIESVTADQASEINAGIGGHVQEGDRVECTGRAQTSFVYGLTNFPQRITARDIENSRPPVKEASYFASDKEYRDHMVGQWENQVTQPTQVTVNDVCHAYQQFLILNTQMLRNQEDFRRHLREWIDKPGTSIPGWAAVFGIAFEELWGIIAVGYPIRDEVYKKVRGYLMRNNLHWRKIDAQSNRVDDKRDTPMGVQEIHGESVEARRGDQGAVQ